MRVGQTKTSRKNRVPAGKQVIDGVTGIDVSKKVNGAWQKPGRVVLQDAGKLSLDGCV